MAQHRASGRRSRAGLPTLERRRLALLPAGDLRRALAAVERLCILLGEAGPAERRDVAVLYLHAGDLPAGRAHLAAYARSAAAAGAP